MENMYLCISNSFPMTKKIVLLCLLWAFFCSVRAANLQDYLIPTPQNVEIQSDDNIAFHEYQFTQIQNYLAQFNRSTWEKEATFHDNGENIVKFAVYIDPKFSHQEYRLLVKKHSITIISGAQEGIYNGVQTMRQIMTYCLAEKKDLPSIYILDYPNIERRGFMLDISRDKVPTMKTLYQIVDFVSSLKVNELQLYTEHTFAYSQHEIVWKNASPMTPAEIAELQKYCQDRFIDLVPNQNSFGHMENWLKYKKYQSLAECQTDCNTIWGMSKYTSLDPTNPGSLKLVKGLYAELLPNFESKYFNIGCDETVELGLGNSKAECERIGLGRVYLNYLKQLNEEVNKYGKTAQFWGDIVINHDSLIPELPKNMIAMVWGYDSQFRFDTILPKFKNAGLEFYVCPGTSTWRSIIGKNQIAFTNLKKAAMNGAEYGARGMLVTNWGDHGHWQPLSVCEPAMMLGCGYAWNCDTTLLERLDFLLNMYVFQDPTQNTGKAVLMLGDAYELAKMPEGVANVFHLILRRHAWKWNNNYQTKTLTTTNLKATEAAIDSALLVLEQAHPQCADAEIVLAELHQAAALAKHSIHLGLARLATADHQTKSIPYAKRQELANELKPLIANHKKLWVVRNRPGGLDDSAERMQDIYDYYIGK